ncbi:MAG: transcription elongation factor GreA, partial [bacterium]|nr:transcription elongation factor GreA [bacterium]
HGDLSENAEDHAAKERQRLVHIRPHQIQGRMRDLSGVGMPEVQRARVGLGSKVLVLDVDKDEELTYKLVTSEEANVSKGFISTTSPIGRSLLGKEVGDSVQVRSPGGERELEIIELTTIHQAG